MGVTQQTQEVVMTLAEAEAECTRWFDHLKRHEDMAVALQKLAADRRSGACDDAEKRRRLAEIDGRHGVTVYDGARLAQAVRTLLKHVKKAAPHG